MSALWWAFSNLFFAATNDLVFKGYARKSRSQGLFAAIIGVIWLGALLTLVKRPPENWGATLMWGAISGVFSIGGNLLMLDAMKKLDAGVCATIYRLNLVPAVILAALILGESISWIQYAGIGCACLAVVAFLPEKSSVRSQMSVGLIVMIAASLMRAGMGISYKYGFSHGADEDVVPVINSLFWIIGGIVYAVIREHEILKDLKTDRDNVRKLFAYGLGSGVLVAGIVLTMAKSLAGGNASVVLPIMQMSFLVTGVLSVIFLKEMVTVKKVAALLFGVAAVLLLSIKF